MRLLIPILFFYFQLRFVFSKQFDPYFTLGLRRDATQNEIRHAYKQLAMKWHPDRNKSPQAEERFLDVNRAYKILSNAEKRDAYDKFGFDDEQFSKEHFFRTDQQQHFHQYIRWPPPPKQQQHELKKFLLPFASVLGTLFFIFLVGFLLNQMNATEVNNRRRQHQHRSTNEEASSFAQNIDRNKKEQEWHPEDPKAPLTEEEKQHRIQTRIWRTVSPLIHELRAETQFGLIRLLKPGCRSIIVLVDKESKEGLLQQFARHIYCLRNNKTFSFGYMVVPKNLNWFRSLLELTLPGEEPPEEHKEDSASVSTDTTETNSSNVEKKQMEPEEKAGTILREFTKPMAKNGVQNARNRLKNINPKHTLGTVLVICGWKLYFCIYHPMHRPLSIRANNNRTIQLETLGSSDEQQQADEDADDLDQQKGAARNLLQRQRSAGKEAGERTGASINAENVLNGFPTFLERLLEGTVRRYYIPEWPDNLI